MIKRTIYVGSRSYLSQKNKQLIITDPETGEKRGVIPLEDIGILILDNPSITVSNYLLQSAVEEQIAVVTCSSKHLPTALFMPLEGHNIQSERIRKQLNASVPLRKQLWTQTVRAKIENQKEVLFFQGKDIKSIEYVLNDLELNDVGNAEARAAKIYWQQLFTWKGFTRDRDGDFPNAALNYLYAIVRALVARALVSSGMLPVYGIFHRNKYNAYCLADDIMEPYRPICDYFLCDLIDKGIISNDELNTEMKQALLGIITCDVEINKKRSPLQVAISHTTSSLYDCFAGKKRKVVYPKLYQHVSQKD